MGFIRRHALIQPDEVLVVAVSGGADSVCLLHLLAGWQRELGIKLYIAHLNHQLRGVDSEEDARYVANLTSRLGIPIIVNRRDVAAYKTERSCSIEEAARELRYDFLARVASDVGANRVAIGHTRDDQIETILMHILRGTGTSGLRGLEPCSPMPYSKGMSLRAQRSNLSVIRPLLELTREETMSYCQEHQLEPRIDSSNLSLSFLRNRCRLELLPLLREYNPNVDQALLRLAEIAKDDSSFMEQQAFQLWDKVTRQEDDAVHLRKEKINALPVALQRQLLRLAIAKVLGNTRDIEVNHVEAVRSLLTKPVGKMISLPHGLTCWGEYDEVVIASGFPVIARHPEHKRRNLPKQSQLPPCPFPSLQGEFSVKVPGETLLPGWRVMASIAQERGGSLSLRGTKCRSNLIAEFDLHQTGAELFIRQRQPGDRFQPLGMNMLKKLQDFMVDAKIPLSWRKRIPLVCSPRQIIWLVGWRIDDRVKVSEATKEILRLEFVRSE
jgi:tRNA(Ile)-lysidine synthase